MMRSCKPSECYLSKAPLQGLITNHERAGWIESLSVRIRSRVIGESSISSDTGDDRFDTDFPLISLFCVADPSLVAGN